MDSESDARPPSHYFDAEPATTSDRRRLELALPDVHLELIADRGVFASSAIDAGTRYLLHNLPSIPADVYTVLDLGCGYGPIALTVAARAPQADVWAIDVNDRARTLTEANAGINELLNVRVAHPDDVPPGLRFDLIVSNPPIRIGKSALHDVLDRWLGRLAPKGRAWLVVQKHLGSDSLTRWLGSRGHPVERLGSRRGYRLLEVGPAPMAGAEGAGT